MISVRIPAFNEEGGIVETIQRARAALEKAQLAPYEIIVIDDGSTDCTGDLATAAGGRVIRHPHNVGYGRSLKDGINSAIYDTIIITDADGSYPIEEIPVLVERYRAGNDMVVAARTGKYYRESLIKSPMRWVLKKIVEFTASREIPDINSGLRVFNRVTAQRYFNRLSDAFSFTTSMTLAYVMNGKFVEYHRTEYHRRIGKSKVRLFRDSVRTIQYVFEAATYYNPLKIFTLLAIFCFACAVASLGAAFLLKLFSLFILGLGGILLSLLIFALGLQAVLLKQIMDRG